MWSRDGYTSNYQEYHLCHATCVPSYMGSWTIIILRRETLPLFLPSAHHLGQPQGNWQKAYKSGCRKGSKMIECSRRLQALSQMKILVIRECDRSNQKKEMPTSLISMRAGS